MSGNVGEWCFDWYGVYPSEPQTNPTGAIDDSPKVARGGSWNNESGLCRVSNRNYYFHAGYNFVTGFRLVRSANQ